VLGGYAATLAPTVTFWDAGELIAAAKTLGIPHPPGTPLFVLMAHVWASAIPVFEYAVRTNLFSATLSAVGAGCFFLVAQESLSPLAAGLSGRARSLLPLLGGAAAALAGAFTFTNWQNSNETEVYAAATCSIALMAWLALVWRRRRGTPRASRTMLLIVYLGGVSVGNHLLALLVGPAIVAFLVSAITRAPLADATSRRREWAEAAIVAGTWALLVGTGLGNARLALVGLACFVAALAFALSARTLPFAIAALAVAAVGMSSYLFLFLRSAQQPILNEADPSTWHSLVAVIGRAQYPVRTPFDDPTQVHGVHNAGRSLRIIWLQLQNYVLYFDWQWAKALGRGAAGTPGRSLVSIVFLLLGLRGAALQRRIDRDAWWLLLLLFLVTGLGLLAYMNFRPGFSQGWDLYPNADDHEVRERDYFFVVSFVVWGLWAGIALAGIVRGWIERAGRARALAWAPLAIALVPLALNWREADRQHGRDARLAADFAYDLLNSAPPYAVLFTYGDNDTFPLWWAQEVEGVRRDVVVVCLALAQTDWYMRQLRDDAQRPLDVAALPPVWRGAAGRPPTWPLHTLTDGTIDSLGGGYYARSADTIRVGPVWRVLAPGTFLYPNDLLSLAVVQQNLGRRPLLWAITTGNDFAGFGRWAVQQGLASRLDPPAAERSVLPRSGVLGSPVDLPLQQRLIWDTYHYGRLLGGDNSELETTSRSIAATLARPFTQSALIYQARGDTAAMLRNLERAAQLGPNPQLRQALAELRLRGSAPALAPDSVPR
jgi:hypothetical protein